MSNDPNRWKQIWEINRLCFGGGLLLGLGWLCLSGPTMEVWWLTPLGGILMFGGGIYLLKGLAQTIPLIANGWKWGRYHKQGATPRADSMASERDIINAGKKR